LVIAPRYSGKICVLIALAIMNAVGLAAFLTWAGNQAGQRRLGAPTVGELQVAYDHAAVEARAGHDADLKILQTDCRRSDGGRYSCRVDFVRAAADPSQVYLDIAVVERRSFAGWRLLKGLCRDLR
jgi:hypothetical protein